MIFCYLAIVPFFVFIVLLYKNGFGFGAGATYATLVGMWGVVIARGTDEDLVPLLVHSLLVVLCLLFAIFFHRKQEHPHKDLAVAPPAPPGVAPSAAAPAAAPASPTNEDQAVAPPAVAPPGVAPPAATPASPTEDHPHEDQTVAPPAEAPPGVALPAAAPPLQVNMATTAEDIERLTLNAGNASSQLGVVSPIAFSYNGDIFSILHAGTRASLACAWGFVDGQLRIHMAVLLDRPAGQFRLNQFSARDRQFSFCVMHRRAENFFIEFTPLEERALDMVKQPHGAGVLINSHVQPVSYTSKWFTELIPKMNDILSLPYGDDVRINEAFQQGGDVQLLDGETNSLDSCFKIIMAAGVSHAELKTAFDSIRAKVMASTLQESMR